jgi:hypothetical protein
VPGWHERTEQLAATGEIQVLGLVQEQHPDRTRLFMQWKQMDWPVMVDALNLLGVSAVPLTFLIDEAGVIQSVRPDEESLREFLEVEAPGMKSDPESVHTPDLAQLAAETPLDDPQKLLNYADALYLWGGESRLDEAIAVYEKTVRLDPTGGAAHFRLGVAYRTRFEVQPRSRDFLEAVRAWKNARDIDPNQYIWRRRIQQYGPRLDKPYSFYDWVFEAREAIQARGEEPFPLSVEPEGAEFAYPADLLDPAAESAVEPDPGGRIFRDKDELIQASSVVVPHTTLDRTAFRVHLTFFPNPAKKAHWNNEVEDLRIWIAPPSGWIVDSQILTIEVPGAAVSSEVRRAEFELEGPDRFVGIETVPAYALYYVCEDVDGTCLFRRKDFGIEIQVDKGDGP